MATLISDFLIVNFLMTSVSSITNPDWISGESGDSGLATAANDPVGLGAGVFRTVIGDTAAFS